MKYLFFSLLMLPLITLAPNTAHACSCVAPGSPIEEMRKSDAVFSGEVVDIHTPVSSRFSSADPMFVSIEVDRVWKGDVSLHETVRTAQSSASCGFNFEEGRRYLIYANKIDNGISVSLCSRTTLFQNATEDLRALGAWDEPTDDTYEFFESGTLRIAAGFLILLLLGIPLYVTLHD